MSGVYLANRVFMVERKFLPGAGTSRVLYSIPQSSSQFPALVSVLPIQSVSEEKVVGSLVSRPALFSNCVRVFYPSLVLRFLGASTKVYQLYPAKFSSTMLSIACPQLIILRTGPCCSLCSQSLPQARDPKTLVSV